MSSTGISKEGTVATANKVETLKVFLIPSEPVFSKIVKLKALVKKEIGPYWYSDYEPHVSLVYLKAAEGHRAKLAEIVGRQVQQSPAFDVLLGKLSAPGRGLIFLDIDKSLPLRELTSSIHSGIKDYLSAAQVPHEDLEKYLRHHITIGNYIKGDNYEKALGAIKNEKLPELFRADKVVLYREDPATRKNLLVTEFRLSV